MANWNDGIKLLLSSYNGDSDELTREKNSLSDFIEKQENIKELFRHIFESEDFFDKKAFKDAPGGSSKGTNLQHYFNNLVFSPSRANEEFTKELEKVIKDDKLKLPLSNNYVRWKWFVEGVTELKKSVNQKQYENYLRLWSSKKANFINPFSFFSENCSTQSSSYTSITEKRDFNNEFRIFVGPPGCGKTREVKNIVIDKFQDRHTLIQIHPSYGYEDLVEGLKPLNFPDGQVRYDVIHGPLRVLAHKAEGSPAKILVLIQKNENGATLSLPAGTKNRFDFEKVLIFESQTIDHENNQSFDVITDDIFLSNNFLHSFMKSISDKLKNESKFVAHLYFKDVGWGTDSYALILDELNRGNVPQLLGELIYLLGEGDSDNTLPVKLQYSQESLTWPSNLSLYATMNSADVSTDRLDQAVKRRFAITHIGPNEKVFDRSDFGFLIELNERTKFIAKDGFKNIKSLNDFWKFCKAETTPQSILTKINDKVISEASSFGVSHPHEKLLGHSYFLKICRKTATSLNGTETDDMKAATLFLEILEIVNDEIIPALASILNADEAELNRFLKELSEWPRNQNFSVYNFAHIEQFVEKMVFKEPAKVTSLKDYKDLKSKKWPNAA